MTISTQITLDQFYDSVGQIRFLNNGCFGSHNQFNYCSLPSMPGSASNRAEIDGHNRMDNISGRMQTLEFYPHCSAGDLVSGEKLEEAVDFFNSIGVYKDMFAVSPVNSIWVDLRNNPADKVFTGLMSIRDHLYYGLGNQQMFQNIEGLTKDQILLRKRIAMFLSLGGVSFNTFGEGAIRNHVGGGGNEGCATLVPEYADALAAYFFVFGSKDQCADAFAQEPVGVGINQSGYIRNGRDVHGVCRRRGYNTGTYAAMSHWLKAWVDNPGHKDASFDAMRGRMNLNTFFDRIIQRIANVRNNDQKVEIVLNIFDEMKEYYE